jgi:hypothetical protein
MITKLKAAPIAKSGTCLAFKVLFTVLEATTHIGSITA